MNDLVSVVIPVYNREGTIKRAVLSVLAQSYQNLEVIVVDDGSTDATRLELDSLADSRLRILETGGRRGANFARNLGIQNAVGDWVAFQDSDDVWLPDKLQKQLNRVCETGADAVFCRFLKYDRRQAQIYPPFSRLPAWETSENCSGDQLLRRGLRRNLISTQTLLAKTSVIEKIGAFDNQLPRFQDWDLAIRLFQQARVAWCDEPLALVFLQSDSITRDFKAGIHARKLLLAKHVHIFRKYTVARLYFLTDLLVRMAFAIFKGSKV